MKHLGATTIQPWSSRPCKLTEQSQGVLKCIARKNCLSFLASLTTAFQTAFESNLSTRILLWELNEIGFHGQAAAPKDRCV